MAFHKADRSHRYWPTSCSMTWIELEARGHRFSRYADDFLIFVRSRSAAERVLRTVTRFIEGTLGPDYQRGQE